MKRHIFGNKLLVLASTLVFTLLYPQLGTIAANRCCTELFGIGWMYLHHFIQMLLALTTMLMLSRWVRHSSLSEWGINLKSWKWSVLTAAKFAAGWLAVSTALNLLYDFSTPVTYSDGWEAAADLVFDFAVTAVSEETLFRGLVLGILIIYLPGRIHIGSISISYAVLVSALFFSLAHIGINYREMRIDHFDGLQMVFTGGLGLFYGIMREKSGSLLGPVLAHGFSDGTISVIQMIIA